MTKLYDGTLSLFYEYELRDKDNKILRKRKKRSHSFVENFLIWLYSASRPETSVNVTDTSGTPVEISCYGTSFFGIIGSAGNTTYGIVVGTGSTAVDITDYNLETLIVHGTGAGQLSYSGCTYSAPSTDASGTSFRVTRILSNDSGGSITIEEIGMIRSSNILIMRDVLGGSAITVNDGQELTLSYIFQTTI